MERCMLTFFNLEDFGFKHIMWVYSGRRGVHCWVSDERARRLNNESRKAIVGFLEVIKVITASISISFICILIYEYRVVLKVLARSSYRLHYILHFRKSSNSIGMQSDLYLVCRRSLDILKPYFGSLLLEEQGILDTPESWEKVLNILPDAGNHGFLDCHCWLLK